MPCISNKNYVPVVVDTISGVVIMVVVAVVGTIMRTRIMNTG